MPRKAEFRALELLDRASELCLGMERRSMKENLVSGIASYAGFERFIMFRSQTRLWQVGAHAHFVDRCGVGLERSSVDE